MKVVKQSPIAVFAVVLFILSATMAANAQGRGRGGGQGNSGGPPSSSNAGGNRGNSAPDMRSNGRNSDIPKGHSNDHNGQVAKDRNMTPNELNRYRSISKKLGIAPEKLHSLYLTESKLNPNLTFGQFVAANTVSHNLNSRYPGVTSGAILVGLRNGHSIGQTLKTLRVEPAVADRAEKEAKKQIKELM